MEVEGRPWRHLLTRQSQHDCCLNWDWSRAANCSWLLVGAAIHLLGRQCHQHTPNTATIPSNRSWWSGMWHGDEGLQGWDGIVCDCADAVRVRGVQEVRVRSNASGRRRMRDGEDAKAEKGGRAMTRRLYIRKECSLTWLRGVFSGIRQSVANRKVQC